jgi:hypothetical protein
MSRRYGKVERSPGTTINEMLIMHRDQVFAWIAERTGFERDDVEEEMKVPDADMNIAEDLVMSLEKPEVKNGLTENGA